MENYRNEYSAKLNAKKYMPVKFRYALSSKKEINALYVHHTMLFF
ncbi:hypothetical protein EC2722950_4038 [Escherichia coli 2722950]|nr:hypothetical protein EC2865200_4102 [Escherichia coli 2865200]EMZ76081.1 hypothetical protein EC2722950_4038 [Escherichia coli 2722950]